MLLSAKYILVVTIEEIQANNEDMFHDKTVHEMKEQLGQSYNSLSLYSFNSLWYIVDLLAIESIKPSSLTYIILSSSRFHLL